MSPEQLHRSRMRRSVDGIRSKPSLDLTGATIAIIGLDPDGFSLARAAASRGFETIGYDTDEVKVAQLEAADAEELDRNLSLTSDGSRLRQADVFVICVPVLASSGRAGLYELERAAELIGREMREGSLVIVGSTVFPGVSEHLILPILEKTSGLARPGQESGRGEFFFAHAPAVIDEQTPRVIGAPEAESLARATAFYRVFPNEIVHVRSIKEAESVRMVEDSLRDAGLAVAGEFSILFDRIGIDIVSVLNAVRSDLFDAASFSGIRTPRSSASAYYLARSGHEHEIDRQFLASARRVVEHMPEYAVSTLTGALRELKIPIAGATVAVLGLSESAGRLLEHSVGWRIRDSLTKKGVHVRAYDPYVAGAGSSLKETLEGAQAAIIASDLAMFRSLAPRQFEELGVVVVVDARNSLDKEGFAKSSVVYRGIGRG